jgi:peptidoglycan-associated lipoprotein
MRTISYGKERPVCTEEVESCWSQNRRGHMVITGRSNVG